MDEARGETLLLDELINFRRGVCHIVSGSFQATGFHLGHGWIMSVDHNFQVGNNPVNFHSLLSRAEFIFETIGGEERRLEIFLSRPEAIRMAFIHHLHTPDGHNKGIAMVKIGIQYERERLEIEEWEEEEQIRLEELSLPCFTSLNYNKPHVGDRVYSIHYGDGRPIKLSLHTVTRVSETRGGIPMFKFNPTLSPGASGCPILKGGNELGGLFYDGNVDEGSALEWEDGIYPYVKKGLEIIRRVEPYMSTDIIPPELEAMANENSLIIYLSNGEVINA